MARYIGTTEVAKFIRKALKTAFPATKFSVRSSSFAGGSAVDISWVDGPTDRQVSAITDMYQGGGFDGMIDMGYSIYHWLQADGTVTLAQSDGTVGSRGVQHGFSYPQPAPDAELVHFGAKFVQTRREFSDAMRERALESVKRKLAHVQDLSHVHYEVKFAGKSWQHLGLNTDPRVEEEREWLSTLIHRDLGKRTSVRSATR